MNNIGRVISQLSSIFYSNTAISTYYVFIGNFILVLFSFIFTVLLVRLLPISDFGYFSALLTFMFLVSEIADIGIGSSLSRFLPKLKKQKAQLLSFIKSAFMLQIMIILAVTSVLGLSSLKISKLLFKNENLISLVLVISVFGISFSVINNFFQFSLAARQKFIQTAVVSSLSAIIRLILLIIFMVFSAVTLQNVVWLQVFSLALSSILAFFIFKPNFIYAVFNPHYFKKLVSFTSLLGTARILTAISSKLDIIMLIALSSAIETGIYATSAKVVSVYPIISGSFLTVIAPRISSIKDKSKLKQFLIKVIIATLGIISSIIIFMIIASPFMRIVFGQKASPAVPYLRILLLGMIFLVGSIPPVAISVYYLSKPYILTISSILQIIIVVVGNLILIPVWGGLGAAISIALAYGLSLLLTVYLSVKHYNLKKND